MKATFEEKTYENYFNTELGKFTSIYYPLGQVKEGFLGFDASAMTKSRKLWKILGHPFWLWPQFSGISLKEIAEEMENYLGVEVNHMPKIKCNLLFQYKRPELITKPSGREWNLWNKPYYRYDIDKEQHDLLVEIDKHFGKQVYVVYASPALISIDELVNAYLEEKVIEKSNFKKATSLTGHHRNTYLSKGLDSIACSEPVKLDDFDLIQELEMLESTNEKTENYNQIFITNFSKKLSSFMSENSLYSEPFLKLKNSFSELEEFGLLYSHLILQAFSEITGIQWLIKI